MVAPPGAPRLPVFSLVLLAAATFAALPAHGATSGSLPLEHRKLASSHGSIEADAGQLLVPENRAVATSRRIPIRFLRLQSTAAKPRAPLFYLAGGPGDHGVSDSKGAMDFWAPFLAVSDVVLIDQRGVGDQDL